MTAVSEVILEARAKINLSLDVLSKRPDGYHEVEMVMQSISLADRLHIRALPKTQEVRFHCSHPLIPQDESNLVLRAYSLLRTQKGLKGGVEFHLEKNIPVAAGLAGGSTDGAAALKGLNQLFDMGLSHEELLFLAAQLGSDVPFCLEGGTALARGRGEILTPLPAPPRLWLLLVKPAFGVSTADVYKAFRLDNVKKRPQTQGLCRGLKGGCRGTIIASMGNVLETVTMELHPQLKQLRAEMMAEGALIALMSGSGPTVFGVYPSQEEAEKAGEVFSRTYEEVFVAHTV